MNNDFRIGEKAVYPAHGVAEVIGIEKKEINTTVCSFYVLKVLATGMQILVPKDKADQVGLRRIAGRDEIAEVMEILRDKEIHIDRQTWNRRYRGFMEKIKSGSLFEVAEVFEVPLAFLMNPANHRRHEFEFAGVRREFLSIPWDGQDEEGRPRRYFIWGATAGMLRNLYSFLVA